MDLDKLKDTWQSAEIKSTLDEDKVQQILDQRGQTALEKLVRYEKTFTYLACASIIFLLLFWFVYPHAFWLYLVGFLTAIPWQIYKYRHLESIDISNLDILQTSQKINSYKKYLTYELIVGMLWTFILFYVIVVFDIFDEAGFFAKIITGTGDELNFFMMFLTLTALITYAVIFLMYYKLYWKNIRAVQEAIKEVDYFEKDNH